MQQFKVGTGSRTSLQWAFGFTLLLTLAAGVGAAETALPADRLSVSWPRAKNR